MSRLREIDEYVDSVFEAIRNLDPETGAKCKMIEDGFPDVDFPIEGEVIDIINRGYTYNSRLKNEENGETIYHELLHPDFDRSGYSIIFRPDQKKIELIVKDDPRLNRTYKIGEFSTPHISTDDIVITIQKIIELVKSEGLGAVISKYARGGQYIGKDLRLFRR